MCPSSSTVYLAHVCMSSADAQSQPESKYRVANKCVYKYCILYANSWVPKEMPFFAPFPIFYQKNFISKTVWPTALNVCLIIYDNKDISKPKVIFSMKLILDLFYEMLKITPTWAHLNNVGYNGNEEINSIFNLIELDFKRHRFRYW